MVPESRTRYGAPVGGNEKDVLTGFLDYYRGLVVEIGTGLPREQLVTSTVPSGTTLLGLVKHLTLVEDSWFSHRFGGEPQRFPWDESDPNSDFRIEEHEDAAPIIAAYNAECERSRQTTAGASLDDTARHPDYDGYTLRWIIVHMIEEIARHCGHADIIREQLDGRTGVGYES